MIYSLTHAVSSHGVSYQVVPINTIAGIILAILFIYLFFRHFLLVMMFMDLINGWLRQFNWFPKEGKRARTLIHWLIAVTLLVGYLSLAGFLGWLKFLPQ